MWDDVARIIGMRRLIGVVDGVTHAHHNGTLDPVGAHLTACGICFVAYDLPNESAESSLHRMFRIIDPPGSIDLLRGTFEDRPVDCMSCLVKMRTWDQRWT